MDGKEERIRARAHQIWLDEGSPEGKAEEHWEKARRHVESEDQAAHRHIGKSAEEAEGGPPDVAFVAADPAVDVVTAVATKARKPASRARRPK